jgi:hypothetical protein
VLFLDTRGKFQGYRKGNRKPIQEICSSIRYKSSFLGEELSATEKYMTEFIRTFRYTFDEDNKSALPYEVKVLKGATGQLIFPSHEGAKYKISVNITVEV